MIASFGAGGLQSYRRSFAYAKVKLHPVETLTVNANAEGPSKAVGVYYSP